MTIAKDLQDLLFTSQLVTSYDVVDMYNSIDQHAAIHGILALADMSGWRAKQSDKFWNKIVILTQWVFDSSLVTYGGIVYKQKRGLPMGSPLSPVIANLYMAYLEAEFTYVDHMLFGDIWYLRYLDDVLILSTGAKRYKYRDDYHPAEVQMDQLIQCISDKSGGSIKFESSGKAFRPGDYVEFLDLKISIYELRITEGAARRFTLHTAVYDKPTNLHIYTDPSTFYPFRYVYSWIQGENIRYIRNSSLEVEYLDTLDKFRTFLFRRGYCESLIVKFIALNTFDDRDELLNGEKPHQTRVGLEPKDNSKNRYITIRNNGERLVIENALKNFNRFFNVIVPNDLRFVPVITTGKSISTVMNKARKNL